tara:strand:- start:1594 stop:1974 length:381 start_codon:yes stop_codon:yes gene_type:complete
MALNLTNEQLLQLAQQVNEANESPYDMGKRHQSEMTMAELRATRDGIVAEQAAAVEQQNQAVLSSHMQGMANRGASPDAMARAKQQLSRYFGTPGTQPVPPAAGASVSASPTQSDLINPANPMKMA